MSLYLDSSLALLKCLPGVYIASAATDMSGTRSALGLSAGLSAIKGKDSLEMRVYLKLLWLLLWEWIRVAT